MTSKTQKVTSDGVNVSAHAISRYRERVSPVTADEARAQLDTPAVRTAIRIGAPYVKLGTGQRIVIEGNVVVTVLPADHGPHAMSRANYEHRNHGDQT